MSRDSLSENSEPLTVAEFIAKLDAACLGRLPEMSLRHASNEGRGFWMDTYGVRRYISTHADADLCAMADVIERHRP